MPGQAVLDAPAAEQLPGCVGNKLWSTQRRGSNIANVSLKVWASPMAPLVAEKTMGQPE